MKAYSLLQGSKYLYRFCPTCGDTEPKKTALRSLGYQNSGNEHFLLLNGTPIDCSHYFVEMGGKWRNLAKAAGEKIPVALEELDSSRIPEYQAEKKNSSPSEIPYLSTLEKGVVDEYNLARTNPKQYAAILAEYKKFYNGRYIDIPGEIRIITNEGVSAIDEAIRFLETASTCPPLTPSKGMSKAAKDHVNDIGPKSIVGHSGSDGSNPSIRMQRYGKWQKTAGENISFGKKNAREIVIQLIVDDGVASRGHRKNIFNPNYRRIGVGFGPHGRYGSMCVQTLAGEYSEKYAE
jgi:uncharacterized protein YkwD